MLWLFLIVAMLFVFMYVAGAGNPGKQLTINQAEEILYKGYTTNLVGEKIEGDVVEIYVVNGVGYIRVAGSSLKANTFPKFADFHFTYNNTTEDLKFIERYDDAKKIAEKYKADGSGATIESVQQELKDYTDRYFTVEDIVHLSELETEFMYTKANPQASFIEMILPYMSIFAMLFLGYFLIRMFLSKSGGATNFSKSRAKLVEKIDA